MVSCLEEQQRHGNSETKSIDFKCVTGLQIVEEQGNQLGSLLKNNTMLTKLSLVGKYFIYSYLSIFNTLSAFSNTTDNFMGDSLYADLGEALKTNTALTQLDLSCKDKET